MDVESEHAARVCPSCDALAVAFDPLQGLSVCENCGRVVGDSLLVPHVFEGDDNRRAGVYVGPEDSGTMASAHLLQGTAAAKAIQSAPSKQPIFKSRQVLKSLCSKLDLPPAATEQAQVYLQTLSDKMAGGWSREHLAAGAAYASIRVNQLPLTLLDLASALQEDVVTLGRRYRDSIHLLGLHPPHMQASNLLDRAVGRVMPGSHAVPAVRQDAALVLQWMDAHLADKRRPLTTLGAAIVTACEMNNMAVGLDHVSTELTVDRKTLQSQLKQVREKMLSFASLLPYGDQLVAKNVGAHARTIIRLSSMLGKGAAGEEAAPARQLQGAGAAAVPSHERTQAGQEGEEQQGGPSSRNAAADGGSPASKRLKPSSEASAEAGTAPSAPQPRGTRRSRRRRGGKAVAGRHEDGQQEEEEQEEEQGDEEEVDLAAGLSEAELDGYLRSPDEVKVYAALFETRGEG